MCFWIRCDNEVFFPFFDCLSTIHVEWYFFFNIRKEKRFIIFTKLSTTRWKKWKNFVCYCLTIKITIECAKQKICFQFKLSSRALDDKIKPQKATKKNTNKQNKPMENETTKYLPELMRVYFSANGDRNKIKKFERNFFFLLVYEDRTVSCLSVCFVQNMCVNYGPSIVSCFLKSRFLIINVPFWQHTHAHAHKHVRKYVSFDIYSDCTFTLIYVYMHTRTLTSILVQT